ncbi:MAG: tetratricopeptide repeat protein [Cyclobacteriaceae bacterium]|nr:tetratricopeptide repeat protein [Cyclobacteriaceae bacterium]MDH4295091.1 tetratricopeptide repeat protein [Cyclobacteriaceae bacterium]MDH5248875.1 tetratricopeptide repeat protein [Cyclobacteriaceae bacterium]
MVLKTYYFALLLYYVTPSPAQTIPDSLSHKFRNAGSDSAKARILLDIGEAIEAIEPGKSLHYYKQALTLSKQIRHKPLILSSLVDIGICNIERNYMDTAVYYFSLALPIAEQINDTSKIAAVLANIGNAYLHKKDPVTAIDYYLRAVRLLEVCADRSRLPGLYANLTSLFEAQKQFDKSIEYGNKAFALAQEFKDDYAAVNALLNISSSYGALNQFQKEREILERALVMVRRNQDLEQMAAVYYDLGDWYDHQKQFEPALENYRESYTYAHQLGNQYHLCTAASRVAQAYYNLQQNDQALYYILQAEKLATTVGSRADLKEIYKTRAAIEQQRGDFKKAYDYLSKSSTLSDSLFKLESSEKIAEMEAKYQNEKKIKEILQLQQEKALQQLSLRQKSTFNYVLLGSIATLLIIVFLAYRNFKHKQKLLQQTAQLQTQRIKELEQEKKLVAYNSLLKGQELERSRMAKDLHDGLGGMLSGVKLSLGAMKGNIILSEDNTRLFARVLDQLDHSISEMRRVAHNMMPEALVKLGLQQAIQDYCDGLNESIQLQFNLQFHGLERRMEAATEIVIYRIVQELLNNVVKHAEATTVLVQIMRHDNNLNITIEDNGKGFDIGSSNKKGDGLNNVRSRVDYLKGQLDIQSVPGKGTSIHIDFTI